MICFIKFLLSLLLFIIVSCVLEPYEKIEEIGVCFNGSDEYETLMKTEGEHFEIKSAYPDTINIDTTGRLIDLVFAVRSDTAFFESGEIVISSFGISESGNELPYRYEVLNSYECLVSFGGDLAGSDVTIGPMCKYPLERYDDITIAYKFEDMQLSGVADTFHLEVFCSIDSQWSLHNETKLPSIDTLTLKTQFILKRYVRDCWCSSEFIASADSIIAIIRRPLE